MPRPPETPSPALDRFASRSSMKSTPRKRPATSITLRNSGPWIKKDSMSRYFIQPRVVRSRHRRPRSGARCRHRQGLQRLDAGLLQSGSRSHVRRRHRRTARCLLGRRRNPPHCEGTGFRSILMRPNHVNGRNGAIRTTIRCGKSVKSWVFPSASTKPGAFSCRSRRSRSSSRALPCSTRCPFPWRTCWPART